MSLALRSAVEAAPGHDADDLRDFLAGRHERRADEALLLAVPAPCVAPERFWDLASAAEAGSGCLWDPPAGPAYAGFGRGLEIVLQGEGRFGDLRRRAARYFAQLRAISHPAARAVAPRFFGGFAFEVGGSAQAPWRELGDGCFWLPRLGYERIGDAATLQLLALPEDDAATRAAWIERALAVLEGLAEEKLPSVGRLPRPSFPAHADEDFQRRVAEIVAAIGRGEVEKVVAARHRVVTLGDAEPAAILRRLGIGRKASTRFAFRHGDTTFLGATPERLVRKIGDQVETEALAGSIGSGFNDALLRSGKDLREHQLVVDDILGKLAPLCATVEAPPHPTVRELRDVLHLLTPIVGHLNAPRHVLELVAELHPTPAVAGVPT